LIPSFVGCFSRGFPLGRAPLPPPLSSPPFPLFLFVEECGFGVRTPGAQFFYPPRLCYPSLPFSQTIPFHFAPCHRTFLVTLAVLSGSFFRPFFFLRMKFFPPPPGRRTPAPVLICQFFFFAWSIVVLFSCLCGGFFYLIGSTDSCFLPLPTNFLLFPSISLNRLFGSTFHKQSIHYISGDPTW